MKQQKPVPTDAALLALLTRLRERDRAALEELYQNYGGALLRIIAGRISRPEVAEEVLQDTFVKIWQHIEKFDPEKGRFFTWAAQIAKRTALDKTKTKKYQQHQGMDPILPTTDRRDLGLVESRVRDIGLFKTVNQLKERRRQVIECFYFQNLTQKETSQRLNMPLGSVKTELRNALKDLRQLLAKDQIR